MKQALKIILLTIASSTTAHASGWYTDTVINQLQYSVGADGVHIQYLGGAGNSNPDACEVSDRFIMAYSSATPEREKAMLSGASMAFAASKKADIFLNGCMGGAGGKSYPKVYYFHVKK